MFEAWDLWFADFSALPTELAAVQNYPGQTQNGVTVWPLRVTQYADTGEIVVKYPWLDVELLRLEAPPNYQPFQQYNDRLRVYCLLTGRNPTPYEELVAEGQEFLDPPRTTMDIWVAPIESCAAYEANLAAQAAAEREAEAAAVMVIESSPSGDGMSMLMDSGACVISNEMDRFSILSIGQDTNQWTTIRWQSSSGRTYNVLSTDELTTNTEWVSRATLWGEDCATSWTDTTTTNVSNRFYKVRRMPTLTGTDFWVAYMNMAGASAYMHTLIITGPVGASGTIFVPCYGNLCQATNIAFSIPQEGLVETELGPSNAMITSNDVVQNKGIHITADLPVSVYAIKYALAGSEGFTGYPTPMLGTSYCVMARAANLFDYGSQFAIVSTESNTTVNIKPSAGASLYNHPGTNQFTLPLLQPGETYQLLSDTHTNDVTGTFITSNKPIGVFAGARLALVPSGYYAAANPLVEQQFPLAFWGKQALGIPLATRVGSNYRVLAASDNTDVRINGIQVVNLQKGQFYDLITNVAVAVEFSSSNSIQVAQFSSGARYDGEFHEHGDPFEMLLLPTDLYMNTYIVSTPADFSGTDYDFEDHYLNLIVDQSTMTNTWCDGQLVVSTNFVPIGTSGYCGAHLKLEEPGAHTVSNSRPFGVSVYGFGTAEGYGYPGAGANMP